MERGMLWAVSAIVIGLALLVTSFAWPFVLQRNWVWDERQAEEHSQAAANLHQLTHETAEVQIDPKIDDQAKQQAAAALKSAKDRYQASRHALQRARGTHRTAAIVMRWVGVAFLLVGTIRYMALKENAGGR